MTRRTERNTMPDTWSLSAFNTYWCEEHLLALGGVPRDINPSRLDKGDFGGFWDFADEAKYNEALAYMQRHKALKEELKTCTDPECRQTFTLEEFFKDKSGKNYRKSRCKRCETKHGKSKVQSARKNGNKPTLALVSSTPSVPVVPVESAVPSLPSAIGPMFAMWLPPDRVASALETLRAHCALLRTWLRDTEAMCQQFEVLSAQHQAFCASANQVEELKARICELEAVHRGTGQISASELLEEGEESETESPSAPNSPQADHHE